MESKRSENNEKTNYDCDINNNNNNRNRNEINENNFNNEINFINNNKINKNENERKNNNFEKILICFGDNCCSLVQQKCIKFSNKIIVSDNILRDLLVRNIEMPYFFRVINPEIDFGVVCGIHEASAPPGICYLPNHIMEYLNLNDGDKLKLKLTKPKNGTYIKLQPHSMDFINMKNVEPKQLLEAAMSKNYPILTQGHTIAIYCEINKRSYYLDVVETKPDEEIKIIDVNLNVDFDPPKDFLRKKKKEEEEKRREEEREKKRKEEELIRFMEEEKNRYNEDKFPGRGFRLGSS